MDRLPFWKFSKLVLCLVFVSMVAPAYALNVHLWSGNGDGVHWSDANNWIGGAPAAGEGVAFGTNRITTADLATTVSFINFTSTGNVINGAINLTGVGSTINIEDDAGGNTINATLALSGATAYIQSGTAAGQKLTIHGMISGGEGVRVYGPGITEFTQATNNTYTGTTTIGSNEPASVPARSAGILQLFSTSAGALVPGDLIIGGTAAGQTANSAQVMLLIGDCIADTSNVSIQPDGQLNLNGSSEVIGTLIGTGSVDTGAGGTNTLTVGNATNYNWGGSIIGSGGLTKIGTGMMTFDTTSSATYGGLTTVAAGTMALNSNTATIVPAALQIGDGSGAVNSAVVRLLQLSEISNSSDVSILADGLLDLNGFNETVGTTTLTGGNITLGAGNLFTGLLTMNSATISSTTGTLNLLGNIVAPAGSAAGSTITAPISLNGATRTMTINSGNVQPELAITGIISNGGSSAGILKNGTGTLDLLGSASNTFTGTTTIDKGVLRMNTSVGTILQGPIVIGNNVDAANSAILRELNSSDVAPASTILINASGLFDLNDHSDSVGPLSGTGNIALGTAMLSISGDATSTTFDGLVSGTGGIAKFGTGTQTFTKNNTYTGLTLVTGGVLAINGTQVSNVLATAGTLAGTGSVGTLTASGTGTVAPGNSGPGTLSSGNLALSAGSTFAVDITPGGADMINVTGSVTLAGTLALNAPGYAATAGTKIVIIANDGADAVSGMFAATPPGSIVPGGTQMFMISYTGGTGNDVELTVQNIAPVISSAANAVPSTAGVNQTVALSAAATDANLDTLTYSWDFGDGTNGSGASTTHAYAVKGNYTATVTVNDGHGGTASSSVGVTVNAPIVGEGNDSDGDGFSDAFETAAGTDPNSAASTPAPLPITILPLVVSKIGIKLNFAKMNSDMITLSGTLHVPAGFSVNGKKVVFAVAGAIGAFTLNSKGQGVNAKSTFKLAVKAKGGTVADQQAAYSMKLAGATFAGDFVNEGLISKDDKGSTHTIVSSALFNGGIYQLAKTVTYKAKKGKSGSAK
ncbi:MAG TPA: PKD domain-containing protein [Planctomycetota bacterium]|nr:PKD domain-containing protein [Planctomycetota bacterium]